MRKRLDMIWWGKRGKRLNDLALGLALCSFPILLFGLVLHETMLRVLAFAVVFSGLGLAAWVRHKAIGRWGI